MQRDQADTGFLGAPAIARPGSSTAAGAGRARSRGRWRVVAVLVGVVAEQLERVVEDGRAARGQVPGAVGLPSRGNSAASGNGSCSLPPGAVAYTAPTGFDAGQVVDGREGVDQPGDGFGGFGHDRGGGFGAFVVGQVLVGVDRRGGHGPERVSVGDVGLDLDGDGDPRGGAGSSLTTSGQVPVRTGLWTRMWRGAGGR